MAQDDLLYGVKLSPKTRKRFVKHYLVLYSNLDLQKRYYWIILVLSEEAGLNSCLIDGECRRNSDA